MGIFNIHIGIFDGHRAYIVLTLENIGRLDINVFENMQLPCNSKIPFIYIFLVGIELLNHYADLP